MVNPAYINARAAPQYQAAEPPRAIPTRPARKRQKRDSSPESPPSSPGGVPNNMQKTRGSLRSKTKVNYAEAEAFADITDDDAPEANSDEERKQKQKNAVAAFDDTSELDDEVERVLSHRCSPCPVSCRHCMRALGTVAAALHACDGHDRSVPGALSAILACRDSDSIPPDPTDAFANQEFYVKWRHWSYIHCSWDTRDTLFQLAGYKRVKNYIKRMEDLDRKRRILSREEIELLDVERQMEYEMSLQHQVVRRPHPAWGLRCAQPEQAAWQRCAGRARSVLRPRGFRAC
jgi:hypothetical protein